MLPDPASTAGTQKQINHLNRSAPHSSIYETIRRAAKLSRCGKCQVCLQRINHLNKCEVRASGTNNRISAPLAGLNTLNRIMKTEKQLHTIYQSRVRKTTARDLEVA